MNPPFYNLPQSNHLHSQSWKCLKKWTLPLLCVHYMYVLGCDVCGEGHPTELCPELGLQSSETQNIVVTRYCSKMLCVSVFPVGSLFLDCVLLKTWFSLYNTLYNSFSPPKFKQKCKVWNQILKNNLRNELKCMK